MINNDNPIKKIFFILLTVSIMYTSAAQTVDPIRIIYKNSDQRQQTAAEYNPIIEEIIKKAAIATGKYTVILRQENVEPEYNTLDKMQENLQQGFYDKKNKENGIKDFKLIFTAPKFHIAYIFWYDYDKDNNQIYYLTLSKIDIANNKELLKRNYPIDSAQMSNFSASIWQACLNFFDLPANLPTFKYVDPGLVREYNNPENRGEVAFSVDVKGARVYIDREYIGTYIEGEFICETVKGSHELTIEKEGYFTYNKSISVAAKERLQLGAKISLKPMVNTLVVNLHPRIADAEIKSDGVFLGRTNLNGQLKYLQFPSGMHTLEVTSREYKTKTVPVELSLSNGKPVKTTFDIELELQDAKITVITNVTAAKIYVDDEYKSTTPLQEPLTMSRGIHTITAVHPDFGTIKKNIYIHGAEHKTINFYLSQKGHLPPYQYSAFALKYGQLWIDDGPVFASMNYLGDDNKGRQITLVGNSLNVGYYYSFLRADTHFMFMTGDNYSGDRGDRVYSFDLMFDFCFNLDINRFLLQPLGAKLDDIKLPSRNSDYANMSVQFFMDAGLAYNVNLQRWITNINGQVKNISKYWHYTGFYFMFDLLTHLKFNLNPFFDKFTVSFPLYINMVSQFDTPNVIWGIRLGVTF